MVNALSGRLRRLAGVIGTLFAVLVLGLGTATPAAAGGVGHHHGRSVEVRLLERPPFVGNGDNPQPGDVLFQEPAVDESGQVIGDSVTRVQVFQDGK